MKIVSLRKIYFRRQSWYNLWFFRELHALHVSQKKLKSFKSSSVRDFFVSIAWSTYSGNKKRYKDWEQGKCGTRTSPFDEIGQTDHRKQLFIVMSLHLWSKQMWVDFSTLFAATWRFSLLNHNKNKQRSFVLWFYRLPWHTQSLSENSLCGMNSF